MDMLARKIHYIRQIHQKIYLMHDRTLCLFVQRAVIFCKIYGTLLGIQGSTFHVALASVVLVCIF